MYLENASTKTKCIFFFQAEDGIRDYKVTGVQTCALPIYINTRRRRVFWKCFRLSISRLLRAPLTRDRRGTPVSETTVSIDSKRLLTKSLKASAGGSRPRTVCRFGAPKSPSTRITRRPIWERWMPRLAATRDFPVPPLPPPTAQIWGRCCCVLQTLFIFISGTPSPVDVQLAVS